MVRAAMLVRVTKLKSSEPAWRIECLGHPELCGAVKESEELLAMVGRQADCFLEVQPSAHGWNVVRRIPIH